MYSFVSGFFSFTLFLSFIHSIACKSNPFISRQCCAPCIPVFFHRWPFGLSLGFGYSRSAAMGASEDPAFLWLIPRRGSAQSDVTCMFDFSRTTWQASAGLGPIHPFTDDVCALVTPQPHSPECFQSFDCSHPGEYTVQDSEL